LLNVLSLNAIFACDLLLVPVSSDFLSLRGALEVERAVNALEPVFRRRLPRRYLLTRFDVRRKMCSDIATRMTSVFGADDICTTRIRENVKLAESPAFELDVFRHAPGSKGALDYRALADELAGAGFIAAAA
jgi:chromosome partitioning protein